jgi:Na+-translocating ferredoxin:NAD+ oxidoreductase subunit C
MVRLSEHKHLTEHSPVTALPAPSQLAIPLSQHIGKLCAPLVKPGEYVKRGQRIGGSDGKVFAYIHASVSGTVARIDDVPHPVIGRCKAVLIDNDGKDDPAFSGSVSEAEMSRLSPEQIRALAQDAGLVGMGGASFPTHIKLSPPKDLESLIINGAECEPYLTADSRLMEEHAREIISGAVLAARCVGARTVIAAIEENKPQAVSAMRAAIAAMEKAAPSLVLTLKVLPSHYPQGGEKQLVKTVLGKEIPSGKLPFDVGVLVQNVATLFALFEAATLHKPLMERVVTVSGDCVKKPGNYLVRIGTPIKDILAFAGLSQEPFKVLTGGPMMGVAQWDLSAPVIKSTNGILAFSKALDFPLTNEDCFRCGRCVAECPVGIMPCMVSLASEHARWDLAKAYGCYECMECGICNYVCPQRRTIVQSIKQAKVRASK